MAVPAVSAEVHAGHLVNVALQQLLRGGLARSRKYEYLTNTGRNSRDYLAPGPPRLTSSLTASCFSLILLTMLVSSSLSPAVSWSTGGMATHCSAQLRLSEAGQHPRKLLGLQPCIVYVYNIQSMNICTITTYIHKQSILYFTGCSKFMRKHF